MKEFKAVNAKQLDLCLKMLYAEKLCFSVTVMENQKQKIEYRISVPVDEQTFERLNERYRILIS